MELAGKESRELEKTRGHLLSAVLKLAAGHGTLQERLVRIYHEELSQISPNPGLPGSMQGAYREIMSELSNLSSRTDHTDAARAARLAKQIVILYDRIAQEL